MLKIYILRMAAGLGVLSGAALGQSVTPSKPLLSFEVASIKPVETPDARAIMSGRRPGMSVDNARVYISITSVMELVCSAYDVSRNRVVGGPPWLSTLNAQKFDIAAKM